MHFPDATPAEGKQAVVILYIFCSIAALFIILRNHLFIFSICLMPLTDLLGIFQFCFIFTAKFFFHF